MYTSLIVTNMSTKAYQVVTTARPYSLKSVNAYSLKVGMSIKNP